MPAHIRKGDVVFVRSGSDRGKTGEVLSVDPVSSTCVVKGINLRTKHLKPTQQRPKGALVKLELPIHISKVSPMADGKPTRVGYRTDEETGKRVRIAKTNGKDI